MSDHVEYVDLADPTLPQAKMTKEQADLILILAKTNFTLRVSACIRHGGKQDPVAVMDIFQLPDHLGLLVALAHILLLVYEGRTDRIPCPPVVRTYIMDLLNSEMAASPLLTDTITKHKDAILKNLSDCGFTQFTFNGPARA